MLVERINQISKIILLIILLFPAYATCSQVDWETELINTLNQMAKGESLFEQETINNYRKINMLDYVLYTNASMYECNEASPAIILIKKLKIKNLEDYLWHENRSVRVFTMLLCFYKTDLNEPIDTYSSIENYIETLKPEQKSEAIKNKKFIENNKAQLISLLEEILKRSPDIQPFQGKNGVGLD